MKVKPDNVETTADRKYVASALPSDTYDNTSTYAESSHTYATSPQTSYANIETQSSKTVASTKGRARGLIKASDGDTLDHEKLDPSMLLVDYER
jgi:hypothetical protein